MLVVACRSHMCVCLPIGFGLCLWAAQAIWNGGKRNTACSLGWHHCHLYVVNACVPLPIRAASHIILVYRIQLRYCDTSFLVRRPNCHSLWWIGFSKFIELSLRVIAHCFCKHKSRFGQTWKHDKVDLPHTATETNNQNPARPHEDHMAYAQQGVGMTGFASVLGYNLHNHMDDYCHDMLLGQR